MQNTEVSSRYAKALFDIASERNNLNKVFEDLRAIKQVLEKDKVVSDFFTSRTITAEEKKKALTPALTNAKVDADIINFVNLLAERNRLELFSSIVDSYQKTSDEAHGVTRGTVKAAKPLSPQEQKAIEEKIMKVTGKKVILNYICDPSILGGLIAEVGGFVFDDTIVTHLKRLKEELKRRAH